MSQRRRFLRRGFLALAALSGGAAVLGQQGGFSDQQLRAAFVLNFLRYVDWPERSFASQEAPLILGVLGGESSANLAGISGKVVKGHPVAVRSVYGIDDAKGCHALYFSDPDVRRIVTLLRGLQNLPVLTVSDAEGFIDIGGMIGLVPGDNRLQFEVNLSGLSQAQLKASSQLLRLARNVIDTRPR